METFQAASEFEQVVEQYQDKVFRLICSVLGPGCDAEAQDATQEVFLKVYKKLGGFRQESGIGTWIYSIARNQAIDRRRQIRRLPVTVEIRMDQVAPHADLGDELDIARAMEKLPEVYRTLVHLFYWQQASLEEISEVTGIKAGTVKSYLARARHNLEAILKERSRVSK